MDKQSLKIGFILLVSVLGSAAMVLVSHAEMSMNLMVAFFSILGLSTLTTSQQLKQKYYPGLYFLLYLLILVEVSGFTGWIAWISYILAAAVFAGVSDHIRRTVAHVK